MLRKVLSEKVFRFYFHERGTVFKRKRGRDMQLDREDRQPKREGDIGCNVKNGLPVEVCLLYLNERERECKRKRERDI